MYARVDQCAAATDSLASGGGHGSSTPEAREPLRLTVRCGNLKLLGAEPRGHLQPSLVACPYRLLCVAYLHVGMLSTSPASDNAYSVAL